MTPEPIALVADLLPDDRESPEWALWVMVALLAFIMLLPTIKR
jgi:hypothetical protein